jgi:hypothetical protein
MAAMPVIASNAASQLLVTVSTRYPASFCAGMAASVRSVGVAQNAIFCGVGTAWRTRSEGQQDGAVMHDRGEYDSGLRDCCLAGYVRR